MGGARLVPVKVLQGRRGDVAVQEGGELSGQRGRQEGLSMQEVILFGGMDFRLGVLQKGLRLALKKGRSGTLCELHNDRVFSSWQLQPLSLFFLLLNPL